VQPRDNPLAKELDQERRAQLAEEMEREDFESQLIYLFDSPDFTPPPVPEDSPWNLPASTKNAMGRPMEDLGSPVTQPFINAETIKLEVEVMRNRPINQHKQHGIIDIETGITHFDEAVNSPTTINYGGDTMSPEGMGVDTNDEGMNERSIEKRYAALMGKKKSKLDRTPTDEKALHAAQEKRRLKASKRLGKSKTSLHEG